MLLKENMTRPPVCVSMVGLKPGNKVKVFVHDSSICNGCYNCQNAGNDQPVGQLILNMLFCIESR
jgi:hypothetical protein